jgi:hypothetical protein
VKDHIVTQAQYAEYTHILAIAITHATLKHSWNKVPVATVTAPEQVCGEARRIGYTGKLANDSALYRLKIKQGKGLPTMTLPGLYIIENGMFQEYE